MISSTCRSPASRATANGTATTATGVAPEDGTPTANGADDNAGVGVAIDDLDDDNGDDTNDTGESGDVGSGADEQDPSSDANSDSDAGATAAASSATTPVAAGMVPTGNRVIWFAEQSAHDHTLRGYRFTITSSPIRVGQEPAWQTLWRQVNTVVLTSATLTVAGSFDHLIDRLGLSAGSTPRPMRTHTIVGSFDYRTQARLMCFDDFPSWAEHSAAAQRLISHQLTGWAAETERHGARKPGAMVLTTSTAAAGAPPSTSPSNSPATDCRARCKQPSCGATAGPWHRSTTKAGSSSARKGCGPVLTSPNRTLPDRVDQQVAVRTVRRPGHRRPPLGHRSPPAAAAGIVDDA